jgi:hypothetical protein
MSRDALTPFALWFFWTWVAVLAHLGFGGGAVQVARTLEDRAEVRRMVLAVRHGLRNPDTTIEILTDVEPTPPPEPAAPPQAKADDDAEGDETDDDAPPDPNAPPDPKAKRKPSKDLKLAEREKPKPEPEKPEPPKPEPPKAEAQKKEEAKLQPPLMPLPPLPPLPPAPPPPKVAEEKAQEEKKEKPQEPIPMDRRLAIRQHVEKEQEDNPEANRIADQANKVEEETMARIRSKDQDDPTPTPGSAPGPKGPKDMVGDSDEEKSAQSEDKAGDEMHAPGEAKDESTSAEHHNPAPPSPSASPIPASEKGPPPSAPNSVAGGPKGPRTPAPEQQEVKGSAGGSGPASPEVVAGERGGYTLDPANPGGDGKSRVAGKRRKPRPYVPPVRVGSVGLGAPGVPGGPNLNLSMAGVEEAVGHEKLKAERAADGASRRSRHRGSWETNKWEKWRAAIENYDPSVKPGNQTALNAARVPFATYINAIHNRLHPIFAEEFLEALDGLPNSHAFNNPNLVTHLEIVLSKDTGRIVRMGITKTSGMTAFDIVALNSVHRASPFGKAPDAIVSPDGNVYLHWEFHRDPYDACTTRNARPFLLKEAPRVATPEEQPIRRAPRNTPSDERGGPPGPLLPLKR